jgi:hypothetical protein
LREIAGRLGRSPSTVPGSALDVSLEVGKITLAQATLKSSGNSTVRAPA